MLFNYFIAATVASTASLLWRALKDDHPKFKEWVKELPFLIGSALTCGFCASLWFTLITILFINPFAGEQIPFTFNWGALLPFANLMVAWFAVGTGVLILRSLVVVLLELGGNLKHQHQTRHNHV
jgi:hypothetical protein